MRKIMAAIDIGNSEIKLVVAEMTGGKFNVLSISSYVVLVDIAGEYDTTPNILFNFFIASVKSFGRIYILP